MILPGDRPFDVAIVPAVIGLGSALAPAVDLGGLHLCGVRMPAAWDAAAITLQASTDGVLWRDVYDINGEVSIPAAAGRHIAIEIGRFVGIGALVRVRSGTGAAPVNQTAARTVELVARAL